MKTLLLILFLVPRMFGVFPFTMVDDFGLHNIEELGVDELPCLVGISKHDAEVEIVGILDKLNFEVGLIDTVHKSPLAFAGAWGIDNGDVEPMDASWLHNRDIYVRNLLCAVGDVNIAMKGHRGRTQAVMNGHTGIVVVELDFLCKAENACYQECKYQNQLFHTANI